MDAYRSNYIDKSVELPIDKLKGELLYSLERHNVLIVVGETGSGKSTKIPQILYSSGIYNQDNRVICITQPRRVAAMQLAKRVSDDLKCSLGSLVGYAVRFKNVCHDEETLIKFETEGLLLKEIMYDPMLSKYSVIMVDEVHERNLNTDILLGLMKCLMLKRQKDLKLIICSATLNVDSIREFFTYDSTTLKDMDIDRKLEHPGILCSRTKSHPVKLYYLKHPVANYLDQCVETVINIHETNRLATGKILVFLTGQDEVDHVCNSLSEYASYSSSKLELIKLVALPLYASLKTEDIERVFDDYGRKTRVCIVSTNIAETSLTINDVAFVVDCGFIKLKIFDHQTNVDTLVRVPISKSAAIQRAGRAGRTRNGIVYRLYTEKAYENLSHDTLPEIQRSSLLETVLLLKSLGVSDLQRFPLISSMPRRNLISALELLFALQTIDDKGDLTKLGIMISQLSLDPKLSRPLFCLPQCPQELCKIISILQVKELYFKSIKKYASDLWTNTSLTNICTAEGDLLSYLNIFNGFISSNKSQKWAERRNLNYQSLINAVEICSKLESHLISRGIVVNYSQNKPIDLLRKSLVSGLFSNVARLQANGDYKTIRGEQTVHIHPTSVYSELITNKPKLVVFVEILNTTKVYMRHLMEVEQDWLLDIAPHFYTFATELEMMRQMR